MVMLKALIIVLWNKNKRPLISSSLNNIINPRNFKNKKRLKKEKVW